MCNLSLENCHTLSHFLNNFLHPLSEIYRFMITLMGKFGTFLDFARVKIVG